MSLLENAIDPELMRLAMRKWASAVTIVSSVYQGIQHGMTVSSFTSVSLSPPLILISLEWGTRTHVLVERSGIFGVMILNYSQRELSDRFAGRQSENDDRFAGIKTHVLKTGAPFIEGGLANFDCKVSNAYHAGNHTIYIGEVLAIQVGASNQPLLYYDRTYRKLMELE